MKLSIYVLESSTNTPLHIHHVKEVTPIRKPLISDVLKTVTAEKIVQKSPYLEPIATLAKTNRHIVAREKVMKSLNR